MKTNLIFSLLALILLTANSCSEDSQSQTEMGRISVHLTDAPFPYDQVAEVNVTIFKIDARAKNEDMDESDALEDSTTDEDVEESRFITLMDQERQVNLLELTNGITTTLTEVDIPQGIYDLVRVYVKDASVLLADGTLYKLNVPSGAQTGIKVFVNPGIPVMGGLSADLLLDFDVSRSFVAKGNTQKAGGISGFNFKPVIKASNLSTAGTLIGTVTTSLESTATPLEGAGIHVFNETDTTTVFTDVDGHYTVLGLMAGNYRAAAEKIGYMNSDTVNITIVAANKTVQDFQMKITEIP